MASPLPLTQAAIIQDASGHPILTRCAPVPQLRPGMILVKTCAVALNPSDHKMGTAFPSPGAVIGMDFSGTIVALGPDLPAHPDGEALRVGDAVCGGVHGSNPVDHEGGAFAEYIRAWADLVLKVPAGVAMEQAAALGCALQTSCVSLGDTLALQLGEGCATGQPVLVYGGSTASGTMAVQLLKISGYSPVATCSPRNFDLVKSFGADAVFDYSKSNVGQEIRTHTKGRLRHALDCITDQASAACCYAALGRPGGKYAALEACPPEWRTREAVVYEFVMSLEATGMEIALPGEYGRPADPRKRELAGKLFGGLFQRLLDQSRLRSHPVEVVGHGWEAVLDGLKLLKQGGISGKKLVVSLESPNQDRGGFWLVRNTQGQVC